MNQKTRLRIKYMVLGGLIAGLSLSAGCKMTETKETTTAESNTIESSMEPIYDFKVKAQSVRFTVKSNGCTKASHFSLQGSATDGGNSVLLVRNKPDYCRAMPRLFPIELPLLEGMQAQSLVIVNPVGPEHFPDIKSKKRSRSE